MVLATHNLVSERLKKRLGEVDEAMFDGVKWPCELIF
jgi:hypothetical protein